MTCCFGFVNNGVVKSPIYYDLHTQNAIVLDWMNSIVTSRIEPSLNCDVSVIVRDGRFSGQSQVITTKWQCLSY